MRLPMLRRMGVWQSLHLPTSILLSFALACQDLKLSFAIRVRLRVRMTGSLMYPGRLALWKGEGEGERYSR